MRRELLAFLCCGVVSCSLVSGASDLVVGGVDGPAPAQPSAEAGTDAPATEAGADAKGPGIDASKGPPSGSVDTTFGAGGRALVGFGATESGRSLSIAADGSIVVGGRTGANIATQYAIARLSPNGALDPTFGSGGKVTVDFASDFDEVANVAHTSDGHIVAGGRSWIPASAGFVFSAARVDMNGALDPTFASAGKLQSGTPNNNNQDGTFAMILLPGDKPVMAGSQDGNVAISTFLADGQIDLVGGGQSVGRDGVARSVARQSDDKLVLAGWAPPYTNATSTDVIVERYQANLAPDLGFGLQGRINVDVGPFDHAYAVALAPDGKIVVAGDTAADATSASQLLVLRFDATGAVDATFGNGGRVVMNVKSGSSDKAHAAAFDAMGRLLVAGSTTGPTDADVLLLRFAANGTLDPTFGAQGVVAPVASGADDVREIRFAADGRIVIVGTASNGTDADILVQRFWP